MTIELDADLILFKCFTTLSLSLAVISFFLTCFSHRACLLEMV
jgi:hypothetical protein